MQIHTKDDMLLAAKKITAPGKGSQGPKNVLVKGGHRLGTDAEDLFYSGTVPGTDRVQSTDQVLWLPEKRVETKHTHGTGCTLSSAIACRLALGDSPEAAVRSAKRYITQAINDCFAVGKGNGPVGHLMDLYRRAGLEVN
jgi:hydroxymethylpyrimidine/phosphomethylpyrimidine kinase